MVIIKIKETIDAILYFCQIENFTFAPIVINDAHNIYSFSSLVVREYQKE